jgi:hypothetical protein
MTTQSPESLHMCEVCGEREVQVVCSLPGIPMTCGFCRQCFAVGAIPYWVLVANTAAIGGLSQAAEWWAKDVEFTLGWLSISEEDFLQDVTKALQAEEDQIDGD